MSIATPVPGPVPSGRAKPSGLFTVIRTIIRAVLSAISESIEVATRYRILAKLTDEELAALGLTRKDIARVAITGWQR